MFLLIAADLADLADRAATAFAPDPASALAHRGETLDVAMIVIGTREATLLVSIQDFFSGSVAVHLARHQHRPVVIIPQALVPGRGGTWGGASVTPADSE